MKVKVYNMQGRLVLLRQLPASAFSTKGTFLYQIVNSNDKVIYTGKAAKASNHY
jgi:hypothetical protein